MFTVLIEGLDVYAYHGVPAEERAIGHRYLVDIELAVDGSADLTDRLADTVDYAAAARLAESVVRGDPFQTVERLAGAVADELLHGFPMIHEATVSVRKPMPPAPFIASAFGARVCRRRTS